MKDLPNATSPKSLNLIDIFKGIYSFVSVVSANVPSKNLQQLFYNLSLIFQSICAPSQDVSPEKNNKSCLDVFFTLVHCLILLLRVLAPLTTITNKNAYQFVHFDFVEIYNDFLKTYQLDISKENNPLLQMLLSYIKKICDGLSIVQDALRTKEKARRQAFTSSKKASSNFKATDRSVKGIATPKPLAKKVCDAPTINLVEKTSSKHKDLSIKTQDIKKQKATESKSSNHFSTKTSFSKGTRDSCIFSRPSLVADPENSDLQSGEINFIKKDQSFSAKVHGDNVFIEIPELGDCPLNFNSDKNASLCLRTDIKVKIGEITQYSVVQEMKNRNHPISKSTAQNNSCVFNKTIYKPSCIMLESFLYSQGEIMHCDETPFKIKEGKKNLLSYLVARSTHFNAPIPCVIFNVVTSRNIAQMQDVLNLSKYQKLKVLITDGLPLYKTITEEENRARQELEKDKIDLQHCAVHAFRKFIDCFSLDLDELNEQYQKLLQNETSDQEIDRFLQQVSLKRQDIIILNILYAFVALFKAEGIVACYNEWHRENYITKEELENYVEQTRTQYTEPALELLNQHINELRETPNLSINMEKALNYYDLRSDNLTVFLDYIDVPCENNQAERVIKHVIKYRRGIGVTQSLDTLHTVANVCSIYASFQGMFKTNDTKTVMHEMMKKLHYQLFRHAFSKEVKILQEKENSLVNLASHLKQCSIESHIDSFNYVDFFVNFLKQYDIKLPDDAIDAMRKSIGDWQTSLKQAKNTLPQQ